MFSIFIIKNNNFEKAQVSTKLAHVMAIFGDFKFSKKIYGVQRKLRGAFFLVLFFYNF